MTKLNYSVDTSVEMSAIQDAAADIISQKCDKFKDYMMEIPVSYLVPLIWAMFIQEDPNTYVYSCKDTDELELAKLVIARIGVCIKIEGFRIIIQLDAKRLLPEDEKLCPRMR